MLVSCDLVYLAYYALQEEKYQMARKMVEYKDSHYESEQQHCVGNSSDLAVTLRNLKEDKRSCKADNDQIIQAQEKQTEVNSILLQSLPYF